MNTNYELFALKKPTTIKKLDKAKKDKQLAFHPDKHPGEEEEYTELFKTIEPAYERIKSAIQPRAQPAEERSQGQKPQQPKEQPKEAETVDDWFRQKVRFPTKYTMTPEGDLITPSGRVFELNPKVLATPEYIKQQFDNRNQKRKEAEQDYITAKRELHDIIQTYKNSSRTDTDAAIVMIANQKVHDAECVLNNITKENMNIILVEGLRENELNIDDPYNTSKIADPVIAGEYATFNWKYFYMDKPQETVPEQIPEDDTTSNQQGGEQGEMKKEKTPEEKARIWAIIRAKKAKARASASFK